ncbi:imidazolonepropionase [Desulfotalea psychrophila]|uniref:Imidazolonepropionase n=1 Tax=Desulfotalea psychrophila (strain LSv54 / DSM 12343) TaxID=177439 RepID=HUTI_DESPS|nr:imidazolonepropionase [Desulfotalea psychrophila]Q6AKP5.1 RecName: Full=Imidazolonepropionase; AltName: Full=Imidazolone-5-propionate hydrolase [Desulfotalea psychrophila LSv54]CAG37080.1 related to imidazolonepropionase [Desulfotalea psychrophila LSv54]
MSHQLFRNTRIYSPMDSGQPSAGKAQGKLAHFPNGALLVADGLIVAMGDEEAVLAVAKGGAEVEEVDCGGRCMIPGFVDPHTHMCFAAPREAEFAQRIAGTSYLQILSEGGGILSSVRAVALAGEDELYKSTLHRVQTALSFGTTSLEIKSGYGLDTDNELKMLRVIGRVAVDSCLDIVATFLGAHAIPGQYKTDADAFITMIVEEMLPRVREQGIARFCDVFCERGVFSIEQSRILLKAARAMGLGLKIHADEVTDLGGAGLAAELGACSADHLLAASDTNIRAMSQAGVIATLLPATAYSLRKDYARARVMIENRVAVALATDCNPGSSFTESMQFVIGLAVLNMEMTPAEALTGASLNSAYALNMADRVGSLDRGKQADFLLLEGETPAVLAYHAGVSSVASVYKRGEKVH